MTFHLELQAHTHTSRLKKCVKESLNVNCEIYGQFTFVFSPKTASLAQIDGIYLPIKITWFSFYHHNYLFYYTISSLRMNKNLMKYLQRNLAYFDSHKYNP
jgi:hypothetical protein